MRKWDMFIILLWTCVALVAISFAVVLVSAAETEFMKDHHKQKYELLPYEEKLWHKL